MEENTVETQNTDYTVEGQEGTTVDSVGTTTDPAAMGDQKPYEAGPAVSTIGQEPSQPKGFWDVKSTQDHTAWQQATAAYGDFKDLTTGIDPRGIQRVLENEIKVGIIDEAIKTIKESENYKKFKTECEAGWKGQSRINFFTKVEEDQALVWTDMEEEYWSIYNRLNELVTGYKAWGKYIGGKYGKLGNTITSNNLFSR